MFWYLFFFNKGEMYVLSEILVSLSIFVWMHKYSKTKGKIKHFDVLNALYIYMNEHEVWAELFFLCT